MEFHNITSLREMNDIVDTRQALLAYFSHQNCNVCRVLKPKVRNLIENHFPRILLYYINTIEYPDVAGQFSVFSVPTLLVFFDGKEYIREGRYVNLDKFYERLEKLYGIYFK
ncbi:MAG: thioredoxin family protein [Bacteroidales bacterium]|nr:thioredoxin family protein [Bacteroidales bacterium]MBS3775250.1 thioredoxin family protein [Bacteroidales bacterium]